MNKDIEVDLIYYELKLQSLLEKFLEHGYHIKNDVYFNRILSFLGGKENKELSAVLLKLPLLSEWIIRAVKLWKDNLHTPPDHSISAFSLQLLGLISKNEMTFTELLKHDIYNQMMKILRVENIYSLPTIKLGFIKLLTSLVGHKSGLEWLVKTSYWESILSISLQNQTVYIIKDGHFFISSFLEAMLFYNEEVFSKIWKVIIMPLLSKPDTQFRKQENIYEVSDEKIQKSLGPTIHLINDILEYFFEKCLEGDNTHMKKLSSILLQPQIIESVRNYLHLVRNQNLTYEIGQIWILLLYMSMVVNVENGSLKVDIDKEFMEPIYSLLGIMVETLKTACIPIVLYFIVIHWYKLKQKVNIEYQIQFGDFKFEDQFVLHLLLPSFVFCQAACDDIVKWHDLKEEFILKLFTKLSDISIRWGYKWRDIVQPADILYDLGPKAISCIVQLKTFLSRDCGVMIFQSLLYSLKHINEMLESNIQYAPLFAKCESYLKLLFEALVEFITYFNISWKDSVESLCVFQASVTFSTISIWPSKIVIVNLNLIKVAINNYLSPDLALLIDKQYNSGVVTLGSILHTKLHDPEWSVRDSALEVISAIAEASCIEFQSFQKIILDNNLCKLVLDISLLDGESFVRASAFKCLNNLLQIDIFWKNHLENQEIIKKIIQVLKQETEGIVRAQAVTLLTTIFRHHHIDSPVREEIYRSMSVAVLNDLHWEVRLNGLAFWSDRVDQKLKEQGMVDNEFPKCTFSPESKKIVRLTELEIKKRIMRVLDDLCDSGCLTALKHAISDDCDLNVSKKGVEVSKKLVDLIKTYKIAENIPLEEIVQPPSNDSCYSSIAYSTPSPTRQNGDDVIDQIVNVSDTALLKDVYYPGKVYTSNFNGIGVSSRHPVTTAEFVNLTRKNFESSVDDRETWINSLDSFSSLLNDMLENYEHTDTNAMDCY